jgi:hypothetical protein
MGMGYGANYADVIEDADVAKVCPKEYKKLLSTLKSCKIDMDQLGRAIAYGENVCRNKRNNRKVLTAYNNVVGAFIGKYEGAGLGLGFHNSQDDGDRYDDVNGSHWCVEGLYELSPVGKKLNHMVTRKMYVTFG